MPALRFRVTLEPPPGSSDPPIEITTPQLEPGEVISLMVLAMQLRPSDEWGIHIRPYRQDP